MENKNNSDAAENPGAALARRRWDRTTKEQRSEVARELNRARAKFRAAKAAEKAKADGEVE